MQAFGFEDEDMSFVKQMKHDDEVVLSTLPPDDRAWAAQHVSVWRRCAQSGKPVLIFQDDVTFSSACSNVLDATKTLVAALEETAPGELIMQLGFAEADDEPLQTAKLMSGVAAGGLTLTPMRSASQVDAYVLWPRAARVLLNSLPLDVPVAAFISKHTVERRVTALMISPALTHGAA